MNAGCKPCMDSERQRLLQEISKVDFVLKELNLYLDTHPYDQQAMERFGQYNALKNRLVKDYTEKYGPLVLSIVDMDNREWKWATQDWPWEGGYN
ncbi:MAG: spore coat protein CotJB [Lachnospiraceae bacterium]|nr:spore coat protein CotJB [Lachnospiraceae bacterium]MDE7028761.1 spore coat protein CotJB [Lachnospiraceae bacterium]